MEVAPEPAGPLVELKPLLQRRHLPQPLLLVGVSGKHAWQRCNECIPCGRGGLNLRNMFWYLKNVRKIEYLYLVVRTNSCPRKD